MSKRINITSRYLKNWLTEKFKELEIDHPVLDCHATRCTRNQYECGAAFYILRVGTVKVNCTVYVFYSRRDLNELLNSGYELYFKLADPRTISEAEIYLRKK